MADEKREGNSLTRRKFLRAMILMPPSIALAAATKETAHELEVALKGNFTENGVRYLPMYEVHKTGKGGQPLPRGTTGLFLEYSMPNQSFQGKVYDHYSLPVEELVRIISLHQWDADLLEEAKKRMIPVGIGDVLRDQWEVIQTIKVPSDNDKKRFYQGVIMAVTGASLAAGIIVKNTQIGRRDFLATFAAGIGTLVGMRMMTGTKKFEDATTVSAVTGERINRLLVRLHGMASNLHPEDHIVFTRNVIMAMKCKTMGESEKKDGVIPLVIFKLGTMHSGIEDLISLPMPILRSILVFINREYLAGILKKYGENVARTRLIQADVNGIFQDLPPLTDTPTVEMLRLFPAQIKTEEKEIPEHPVDR